MKLNSLLKIMDGDVEITIGKYEVDLSCPVGKPFCYGCEYKTGERCEIKNDVFELKEIYAGKASNTPIWLSGKKVLQIGDRHNPFFKNLPENVLIWIIIEDS